PFRVPLSEYRAFPAARAAVCARFRALLAARWCRARLPPPCVMTGDRLEMLGRGEGGRIDFAQASVPVPCGACKRNGQNLSRAMPIERSIRIAPMMDWTDRHDRFF